MTENEEAGVWEEAALAYLNCACVCSEKRQLFSKWVRQVTTLSVRALKKVVSRDRMVMSGRSV